MELFEVGGCIRDEILGVKSKDIDFTVVLSNNDVLGHPSPFDAMRCELRRMGFEIFLETPEYFTIRARFPRSGDWAYAYAFADEPSRITADFVLARKEGSYSDGRRPDAVEVGTLQDDLARRDFTMNAIAKDAYGRLIDPFNGQADIADGIIRAVGKPGERLHEDALRGLRALRFSMTKRFTIEKTLSGMIKLRIFRDRLSTVSNERIREELDKMFAVDSVEAIRLLDEHNLLEFLINPFTGIRLMPTMKG